MYVWVGAHRTDAVGLLHFPLNRFCGEKKREREEKNTHRWKNEPQPEENRTNRKERHERRRDERRRETREKEKDETREKERDEREGERQDDRP